MTATLAPIDQGLVDRLRQGDEAALASVFREDFVALKAEAEEVLHDPLAARRAVEHAFVQLWEDRERVSTPEGLNALIGQVLHEQTARERRRLATAHRLAAHAGTDVRSHADDTTVDEAWQHVEAALHATRMDDATRSRRLREEAKHHAAEHVADLGKRRSPLVYVGATLALLAGGLALVWALDRAGADARVNAAFSDPDASTIRSNEGQLGDLALGDGTRLRLGPVSSVTVPPGFNTEFRAVQLDGTASFTVAPNPALPFQVRSGKVVVTATGTVFAVRAWRDEGRVAVVVREGTVTVRVGELEQPLAADAAVLVDPDAGTIVPLQGRERQDLLGWVDGMWSVSEMRLGNVVAETRRWFGLPLLVPEVALQERVVSVQAPLGDSRAAIAAIEQAAGVRLQWEEGQMVLRDAR
jgi:ferric-dicitrate binding protein FerR (iron transport regulator)